MAIPNPLSSYSELNYDVLHHDLRVFIQGVEVTQDVKGSLNITMSPSPATNIATFELDNALEKYIINEVNLPDPEPTETEAFGDENIPDSEQKRVFGSDNVGKYSEDAKREIFTFKTGVTVNPANVTDDRTVQDTLQHFLLEQNSVNPAGAPLLTTKDIQAVVNATVANLPANLFTTAKQQKTFNKMLATLSDNFTQIQSKTQRDILTESFNARVNGQLKPPDQPFVVPNASSIENLNATDQFTNHDRWEFHGRDLILTQMDPVAIFAANPYSEDPDQWFQVFSGVIVDYPMDIDYINGSSNIRVNCHCIRWLLQKMRVASNSIIGTQEPQPLYDESAGFFQDLINPDALTQQFSGKSLEDIITQLMTGHESMATAIAANNASVNPGLLGLFGFGGLATAVDILGKKRGVGRFTIGTVKRYPVEGKDPPVITGLATPIVPRGPEVSGDDNALLLQDWNTLALFGDKGDFLTFDECTSIGKSTRTGDIYDPANRRVHFLLPRNGTAIASLVEQAINRAADTYNFKSRAELLNGFLATMDYKAYVSGSGDLMVEFPTYDFIPEDWGAYNQILRFNKHLLSGSVTYESADIVTAITVTGALSIRAEVNGVIGKQVANNQKVVLYSPQLAARYGATTREISMPFIVDDLNKLAQFGAMEFQKILGNASSMTMGVVFRPFLLPNRPILNEQERKMGLTTSVTNTWNIFDKCDTTFTLEYIRASKFAGFDPENENPIFGYHFLTGGTVMPMSFRFIQGVGADPTQTVVPGNKLSGIRIFPAPGTQQQTPEGPDAQTPVQTGTSVESLQSIDSGTSNQSTCQPQVDPNGHDLRQLTDETRAALYQISAEACLPIVVTSARRSQDANTKAHGAANSKHLSGQAWDARIYIYTKPQIDQLVAVANRLGYVVFNETDHLHFEKRSNSKQLGYSSIGTAASRTTAQAVKKATVKTRPTGR